MLFHNILRCLRDLILSCPNPFTESHSRCNDLRQSQVSDLPTSILVDIFLKLPLNTIIRCKCVCKLWHNLISDPDFLIIYRSNSPFTSIVRSEHRTITDPLDDGSFHILEIGINGDVFNKPFFTNVPDLLENGIVGVMGSCNGLLCLVKSPQLENESRGNYIHNRDSMYNNQIVCIVNPLFGECITLPDVKSYEDIRDVIYGFGSSALNDNEYKIIRLVIRYIFLSTSLHEIEVFGEIFTLGVDVKWRCFKDSSIPCYTFPCGVALNGSVHWIGDNRQFGVIYAFDVAAERGGCITFPHGLGDEPGIVVLAVWNGNLCITDNSNEFQVDVWVMKQYGVAESWSRDLVLRGWIPYDLRAHPLVPVATLRNGDLLMSRPHSGSLMSFDPMRKRCSKLDSSCGEGAVSFSFGFTPNFVPLSLHIRNHSQVDV